MTVSKKAFEKQQEQIGYLVQRVSALTDELSKTQADLERLKARLGADVGTLGEDVLAIVDHIRTGKNKLGNVG